MYKENFRLLHPSVSFDGALNSAALNNSVGGAHFHLETVLPLDSSAIRVVTSLKLYIVLSREVYSF